MRAADLSKEAKASLIKALYLLSQNVRHPSLQTKKVKGTRADLYECRVDQGTRLVYDVKDGALRCWYVGDHDAALCFAESSGRYGVGVAVDDIQVVERAEDLGQVWRFLALAEGPPPEVWLDVSGPSALEVNSEPGGEENV